MSFHSNETAGAIHVIYNWSYADATARNAATGFVSTDVGKVARQEDDNSYWLLIDYSPIEWQFLSGGSGSLPSHASNHQHGGVDEVATETPAAYAIPKAGSTGDLDEGWIPHEIQMHYRWSQAFYNGNTTPYLPIKTSGSYQVVCRFVFPGTDNINLSPDTAKSVMSRQNAGITVSVRIYDLTNSNTIAETTAQSPSTDDGDPTVLDLGTVSNLPTTEAVFEIQVASSSAAASAEIHYISLYRV